MTDPAESLARFTPTGPDAAELLVRIGRASAPTRLRWKLAVAGLLLTNSITVAWLTLRPAPPVPDPVIVPVVVPVPVADPLPGYQATALPRDGGFRIHDDPDRWPAVEPLAGVAPPGPPLTPLAGRRADID